MILFYFRRSLDLVEILLHLSENTNYESVLKLFAWPVKNCPDILVLALLQLQVSKHFIDELCSSDTFFNG